MKISQIRTVSTELVSRILPVATSHMMQGKPLDETMEQLQVIAAGILLQFAEEDPAATPTEGENPPTEEQAPEVSAVPSALPRPPHASKEGSKVATFVPSRKPLSPEVPAQQIGNFLVAPGGSVYHTPEAPREPWKAKRMTAKEREQYAGDPAAADLFAEDELAREREALEALGCVIGPAVIRAVPQGKAEFAEYMRAKREAPMDTSMDMRLTDEEKAYYREQGVPISKQANGD